MPVAVWRPDHVTEQVPFRPQARLDLKHLYRYIAEFNPQAAAAGIVHEFHAKAQMLAATPAMGQGVPHLSPGLRRFPVGSYVIFYRPINAGIDVVRILHAARDTESLFQDDSSQPFPHPIRP